MIPSSRTWGDVASEKGRAAHGAEHGRPEDGAKEFLHPGVGIHPVSSAATASDDLKRRTKEIEQLRSQRCPVPSYFLCLGQFVHVGKGTVFGLGLYELRRAEQRPGSNSTSKVEA